MKKTVDGSMGGHSRGGFFFERLRKGNSAYRAGRYDEAVREYREAVRLVPTSAPARSNLGRALAKLGRFKEAIPEFQNALESSPEHGPSLYYYAFCMDQAGCFVPAVLAYEKFLRNSLGSPPGYAEKAHARIREIGRSCPPESKGPDGQAPRGGSEQPDGSRKSAVSQAALSWHEGDVVDGLYAVEELLGEGGFGSVHKVTHLGWHMKLAVKSPREDKLFDPRAKERFVREANIWVGLGFHPNIVTCHFVRLIQGLPRIFLEYLEAGTLREWLTHRRIIHAKPMMDAAIQLARAMESVQGRDLVHRDLKPENCLMTPEGVLKVTDFGLVKGVLAEDMREGGGATGREARPEGGGASSGRYRLGTVEYMSPEQWFKAGKVTSAADVWAFGVMLFEMLHGRVPFQNLDEEPPLAFYCRMKEDAWRHGFREDAPVELKSIVSSCLVEDAGKRESRFSVLRERLEALYARLFKEPYPRPPVKKTPPLADVLNNQGVSMADLGRFADALKLFAAALRQDPTHPGATYNQGILQLKQGRLKLDELASRLAGCKRARPWEWAPEYLRRLVLLQDKKTAVRELEDAQRIWDNPLIGRALSFAKAGRRADALELFVSPPIGTEAALAEEARFFDCLARARREADAGRAGSAYKILMMARGMKGYERSPLSLSLQARLGRRGARKSLKAGWLKFAFEESRDCLCAAVSPDGDRALSGHGNGMLLLWELETGRRLRVMEGHGVPIESLCFLPDMTIALSGARDGSIKAWDSVSGECIRTHDGHAGAVSAVIGLPDGTHALFGDKDGVITVWDLDDGHICWSLPAHQGAVRSVRLAVDGRRAVSMGAEGTLKQWDIIEGRSVCDSIDIGVARAMAITPDGRFALIAGSEGVAEWDLDMRIRTRRFGLKGQAHSFRALDLTSDGKFLLTGGDDLVVRLWDMSGQGGMLPEIWAFEGHVKPISSATFSSEARWALSAGQDGLYLWDLDWEFQFPESFGGRKV